jgi:hypothetical protein
MSKFDRDVIMRMGMNHGLQAPDMIDKGWGHEVAATWLGGLLAGLARSAARILGMRGAYDLFQRAADELAADVTEAGLGE